LSIGILLALNPQFNEWTRERAVSAEATIPYDPAAVQFYKYKYLWNAKMAKRRNAFWRSTRNLNLSIRQNVGPAIRAEQLERLERSEAMEPVERVECFR